MGPLECISEQKSRELKDALRACRDAKEASDTLYAYWDALRAAYLSTLKTEREREIAAPVFEAMMEGVCAVGAVTRAQVKKSALPTVTLPGKPSFWTLLRRYGTPGLCVLSSAACILTGNVFAALLSLGAAAASGWQTLRAAQEKGRGEEGQIVTATPLADVDALLARTHTGVRALDGLLARSMRLCAGPGTPVELLTWTQPELESVQMLWEACEDHDGEYALKAVPLLLSELAGQQVTLRRYGEGIDESFDLLPGLEAGRTIRPALYAGDRLLLRGQATCAPEKVEVTGL